MKRGIFVPRYADSEEPEEISAMLIGAYAVHPPLGDAFDTWPERGTWCISHRATGVGVVNVRGRADAYKLATHFATLPAMTLADYIAKNAAYAALRDTIQERIATFFDEYPKARP